MRFQTVCQIYLKLQKLSKSTLSIDNNTVAGITRLYLNFLNMIKVLNCNSNSFEQPDNKKTRT